VIIGYRPGGGAPGVIAAVALVIAFELSLSWLWAATALLVRDPATVMSLGLAVLLPPTFASNIFVQPRTMPGWLQAFVDVNPLTHVAAAARALMNGGDAGGSVAWSLLTTAAIAAVCGPLTLHLYSRRGEGAARASALGVEEEEGAAGCRLGDVGGSPGRVDERARRVVAGAVVERAGDDEDLFGAWFVDVDALPGGVGVHLQNVGRRTVVTVP